MPITGRPKRAPIEVLRTKAWLAYAKRCAGVTSAYKIAQEFGTEGDKHFEKYQRGTISPNATSLLRVEEKWHGTRSIYDVGPLWVMSGVGSINVPLWAALAGSMEETWEILVWFDPALEGLRLDGAPFFERIKLMLAALSPNVPIKIEHHSGYKALNNEVARLCGIGQISLNFRLLVGVMAMWRYSMFIGDGWREMNYVVRGLCTSPGDAHRVNRGPDGRRRLLPLSKNSGIDQVTLLLEPLSIHGDFPVYLDLLRRENIDRRHSMSLSPLQARMVSVFPVQYRR